MYALSSLYNFVNLYVLIMYIFSLAFLTLLLYIDFSQ